jgi:hypothetical protein
MVETCSWFVGFRETSNGARRNRHELRHEFWSLRGTNRASPHVRRRARSGKNRTHLARVLRVVSRQVGDSLALEEALERGEAAEAEMWAFGVVADERL